MLEAIFLELNDQHFSARLPVPTLRWNSRLASTAGRFSPGSRRIFATRLPEIEVATYLRDLPDGQVHIRDTMLHEMIHYYLWFENRPYGHTAEFHEIMRRVGAKRYNTVPKLRPVKHVYECAHCRVQVPARRKIGVSACAQCCEKFNGGKFHERFLLRLVHTRDRAKVREPAPVAAMGSAPQASAASPAPAAPKPAQEQPSLPVSEIIRRLEELKNMIRKRPGT